MNLMRIRLSRQGSYGLLLLTGALLFVALLAWLPFYWQSAIQDEMDSARSNLRFIEARINASKGDRRSRLTAGDNVTPLFLNGGTPGLALADLQARVTTLAAASHMTIIRSQPLQTDRQSDLAVLRAELEASGSIDSLRDFLLALETGEPLIFVNQVQISAPPIDKAASDALPAENLTAILQIEAYAWWGASP
jgi:hypothetical protein